MDFERVLEKVKNNEYECHDDYKVVAKFEGSHIFDENMSVKWNREEVERQNKKIDRARYQHNKNIQNCFKNFQNDLADAIIEEYGFNKQEADKIVAIAYEREHSYGYTDVVYCAMSISENYADLLSVHGEEKSNEED